MPTPVRAIRRASRGTDADTKEETGRVITAADAKEESGRVIRGPLSRQLRECQAESACAAAQPRAPGGSASAESAPEGDSGPRSGSGDVPGVKDTPR